MSNYSVPDLLPIIPKQGKRRFDCFLTSLRGDDRFGVGVGVPIRSRSGGDCHAFYFRLEKVQKVPN